jgi:hypothetical protein
MSYYHTDSGVEDLAADICDYLEHYAIGLGETDSGEFVFVRDFEHEPEYPLPYAKREIRVSPVPLGTRALQGLCVDWLSREIAFDALVDWATGDETPAELRAYAVRRLHRLLCVSALKVCTAHADFYERGAKRRAYFARELDEARWLSSAVRDEHLYRKSARLDQVQAEMEADTQARMEELTTEL